MNNSISTVSRILFALVMLLFGINNLRFAYGMLQVVPPWLPGPVIWIYLGGIGLILAAIAFIINKKIRLAGYLLGMLLLIFVFMLHLPSLLNATDQASRMIPMTMIMKDTALAAAAFFIGSKST